jgi:sulfite reductase beta subunit-like hemoprotein
VHQNLVLRWVRDEAVYDVWRALSELGLGDAGADEITDVVSCPGTDSCKLGITSSMGLNAAVQQRLEEMAIEDPLTKRVHIKMSGCPNGCSQHHIANIGFYGASIKVGDKTVPAYVAHLGGRYEGGEVLYGTRLKVRLPAKRVPDAVERWLRHYEANRADGEAFNAFVGRVGEPEFEELVRDLSLPPQFGLETMQMFIDWSRKEPFQVVRGEGECAV